MYSSVAPEPEVPVVQAGLLEVRGGEGRVAVSRQGASGDGDRSRVCGHPGDAALLLALDRVAVGRSFVEGGRAYHPRPGRCRSRLAR